ncbi:hypothetical protein WJX74_010869 [Apatococcus lobatus]|uniref:Uncharacterized protein n=2 Tax=Apatococcus TaxID=904362 RepID=A0AAW1RRD8_9CHLO
MTDPHSRVRFSDKESTTTPLKSPQESERPSRVGTLLTARSLAPSASIKQGEGGVQPPATPALTAADKARLTLWELAELGMHKEIAWKVERTLDMDVNLRDKYGRTALMWAAEQGHVAVIETLLDLGADRTVRDSHTNRSALHLAARCGQADALKALLEDLDEEERVAFLNDADKNGITPVFLAKQKGEEGHAAFEFLMQSGARYTQQATKELPQLPAMMPEAKLPQAKFSSLAHVYSGSNILETSGSLGVPS